MRHLLKVIVLITIALILLVAGGCKSRPAPEKPAVDLARIGAAENALKPEFVCLDGGDTVTFVKGADGRYDQVKYWEIVHSRKKA